MIRGLHAMFYSSEANELREFLRDKLEFNGTDVGGGWLIFGLPPVKTTIRLPSGGEIGLYQPLHPTALGLSAR